MAPTRTLHHFPTRRFGSDYFDRHLLFEQTIRPAGKVDSSHATAPNFVQDFIVAQMASLHAAGISAQVG